VTRVDVIIGTHKAVDVGAGHRVRASVPGDGHLLPSQSSLGNQVLQHGDARLAAAHAYVVVIQVEVVVRLDMLQQVCGR
jgi:hypothetical protein